MGSDRALYGELYDQRVWLYSIYLQCQVSVYTGMHVYIPSFPDNPTLSFAKSGRWKDLRMKL